MSVLAGLLGQTGYQTNSGMSAGGTLTLILIVLAIVVFSLGMYGTFKKAGQPGWAAFVPIYDYWVLLRIVGRPGWWLALALLGFIPFVGSTAVLVICVIVFNDLSKSFGHGGWFTVGLVLLGPIFYYILWLGKSTYRGPAP